MDVSSRMAGGRRRDLGQRRIMHRRDAFPAASRRVMHRTQMQGSPPDLIGPFYAAKFSPLMARRSTRWSRLIRRVLYLATPIRGPCSDPIEFFRALKPLAGSRKRGLCQQHKLHSECLPHGGVGRQRFECRQEIAKGLDLFRGWRAIFLLRFDEIAVIIDRTTDHFIQQMIVLGRGLRGVSGDETQRTDFVLGVADAGEIQEQAEANRHILDGR